MQHRYYVGQTLELRSAPRLSNRSAGVCTVIACLPHENGPVQYRVQSMKEAHERVVDEADLSPTVALAADDGGETLDPFAGIPVRR
jgi:hypothetical protein